MRILRHASTRQRRSNRHALVFWWPIGSLLSLGRNGSVCAAFSTEAVHITRPASSTAWTFSIVDTFPSPTFNTPSLLEHLTSSSQTFPSPSQARRAIQHGEILVLPNKDAFDPHALYNNNLQVEPSTIVSSTYQIHRITRLNSNPHCYPIETTKFVFPPTTLQSLTREELVVYENDELAVVCKPEGMTTIDTKSNRQDLQSLLPFVLSPPPCTAVPSLPRPVHRLDRGTHGLVLIAKTASSLQQLSALFAQRKIHKTYAAVVFHNKDQISNETSGVIDYPIDGKAAVTEWKVVQSNGEFSRLELHPHTGRFHQLRRHLAYCLGTPIVGDPKYDLVGVSSNDREASSYRRSFRDQGLHLCCHELEFDDPLAAALSQSSTIGPLHSYSVAENGAGVWRMKLSTRLPDKMLSLAVKQQS